MNKWLGDSLKNPRLTIKCMKKSKKKIIQKCSYIDEYHDKCNEKSVKKVKALLDPNQYGYAFVTAFTCKKHKPELDV